MKLKMRRLKGIGSPEARERSGGIRKRVQSGDFRKWSSDNRTISINFNAWAMPLRLHRKPTMAGHQRKVIPTVKKQNYVRWLYQVLKIVGWIMGTTAENHRAHLPPSEDRSPRTLVTRAADGRAEHLRCARTYRKPTEKITAQSRTVS
ncbi:hypothetical protein AXG93_725s1260 [Marchantia polymorpha subsp. ruderalis]|uniref:Uncharacterized protein n=1 Tax=Marchantia polymorpha subsp. ruderalis TaxID=1480154 RepID=A0A176WH11_MARPO|nr:hypothetical protein AXG93_725s1260 [Marchantia polymorpha subsp. ruderalis]